MKLKTTLLATTLTAALAVSLSVQAAPFGIYDPRSLAMGGVGVTLATSRNANFYNPAALSSTQQEKDNFALGLPIVAAHLADQDKMIDDIDKLKTSGDNVANAINAFYAAPSDANAQNVVSPALNEFAQKLGAINNKSLEADVFVGGVVAVPSNKLGIGVHVGGRANFGARIANTGADVSNIITLRDAASVGQAALATELSTTYDTNSDGKIDDNVFTTRVDLRGIVVGEAGIALARRFESMGNIDVGITPKIQKIKTLDVSLNPQSAEIDLDKGTKDYSAANFDIGVAKTYGDDYKAGLVIKNVLKKEFATALGNTIELKPQARLGVSHHRGWANVGIDVDLTRNKAIAPGFDHDTQFLALGAELDVWLVQLRLGYRHDLAGNYDGMPSAGLGVNLFGLHIDAAVAANSKETAAGIQLGLNF